MILVLRECHALTFSMDNRLEVKIDLAELQVVLMELDLKFAHSSLDIYKHFLQALGVIHKLWQESWSIFLLAENSVQERLKLPNVTKLLLDLLFKLIQLSTDHRRSNTCDVNRILSCTSICDLIIHTTRD